MLTEALKRKYDKLEKLAKERGMTFEILRVYKWPNDPYKGYFFTLSEPLPSIDMLLEFSTTNFGAGLNRLIREIKDYPVVD